MASWEISLLPLQSIWPETVSSGGRDGSVHSLPLLPQSPYPESWLVLVLVRAGNWARMGTIWSSASATIPVECWICQSLQYKEDHSPNSSMLGHNLSIRQALTWEQWEKSHWEPLPQVLAEMNSLSHSNAHMINFNSAPGNSGQRYQFQNMIYWMM